MAQWVDGWMQHQVEWGGGGREREVATSNQHTNKQTTTTTKLLNIIVKVSVDNKTFRKSKKSTSKFFCLRSNFWCRYNKFISIAPPRSHSVCIVFIFLVQKKITSFFHWYCHFLYTLLCLCAFANPPPLPSPRSMESTPRAISTLFQHNSVIVLPKRQQSS